jgi:hypothetical protein
MTCEQCGGEYAPRVPKRGPISKYCSASCRIARKARIYASKPGVCRCCGGAMAGRADRRYCDACRHTGRFVVAGTRRDFPEKPCAQCGKAFKPSTRTARFCGRDCLQAHNAATQGHSPHTCAECGMTFRHRLSSKQLNKYCSRKCATTAQRRIARVHGRKASAPRAPLGWSNEARARRYGCEVGRVDVLAVFERDGWVCGICKQAVDPLLMWPDPMSASLDHVVPLSLKGGHVESNAQCAHLRCNIMKNNKLAA